jgi:hypothetical protein
LLIIFHAKLQLIINLTIFINLYSQNIEIEILEKNKIDDLFGNSTRNKDTTYSSTDTVYAKNDSGDVIKVIILINPIKFEFKADNKELEKN